MSRTGKKLKDAQAQVAGKVYSLEEGIPVVQKVKYAKFDETVELALRLGVNPRHADQMVRGTVVLPHGLGRQKRVLVIAGGEKQKEAQGAGADVVGGEEMVEKIQSGWMDFDSVVATPDMMPVVGKLGKILGPRGLMPNPKLGSVTMDVKAAVEAAKGGQVEFRAEKAGILHAGIGKASFSEGAILENFHAFVDAVVKARPSGVKGTYINKIALSSSQGPGVRVDVGSSGA